MENPKDEAISGCSYNKIQDKQLVGSKQRRVQLAVSNKAKLA